MAETLLSHSLTMQIISFLLTIVGWLVAFWMGVRLNKKNLKQQTIIETIKYIHNIKQSILDDLSKVDNPNIQFVTQKIRKIRILLKEVVSKKLYNKKYNPIYRCM